MSVIRKLKRAARGEVKPTTVALEILRRGRVSLGSWRDLSSMNQVANRGARLRDKFATMAAHELLAHFRDRKEPRFFPGFTLETGTLQQKTFPEETTHLIDAARRIVDQHRWTLLGYGQKSFGDEIEWRRDPLSGYISPLVFHRNVQLFRNDGSDVRVLWELNRLGHLITLGRAYAVTKDEKFATEFFKQVESWSEQNPFGQGPNWNCAMEVALRSVNLLAAFELFRSSPQLDEQTLSHLLTLFDQHGSFIRQHLEFSYLATSNHYFSDVVGLLWLGTMLPELCDAREWREFGFREMLREMNKQILADGADFESSTGYHRFVLELLLNSFHLCRINKIKIEERYWKKLRAMLEYVRCYLRPDGSAPLIGDSDGGQVLPIRPRRANDHSYLLSLGAVIFNEKESVPPAVAGGYEVPEELLWLFGESGLRAFNDLTPNSTPPPSISFPEAGLHLFRQDDLYLSLNTSDAGINGRGSHGHNDILSIEVAAFGRPFIVDPGTYVYSGDLLSRHRFRSTAYHSTVEIDNTEQTTINVNSPFVIGNEAKPKLLLWESREELDRVSAEHSGYSRLPNPLTHRRTITFNKKNRSWLVEDEFAGNGEHTFAIRFHFDANLKVTSENEMVTAFDEPTRAKLLIRSITLRTDATLERQATSIDYGQRQESTTACWSFTGEPLKLTWLIVPVGPAEDENERLRNAHSD